MNKEITLDEAINLVQKNTIVYIVADLNDNIIKIFNYHKQAYSFAETNSKNLKVYNISHPKCPRSIKFKLGYLYQYDLFLDKKEKL